MSLWVIFAIPIGIYIFSSLRVRHQQRKHREERSADFQHFAASTGGRVDPQPQQTQAWTHGIHPPFPAYTGYFRFPLAVSKPSYDNAVEFTRNGREVRISEANMSVRGPGGVEHRIAHRIEIQATPGPGLVIWPIVGDSIRYEDYGLSSERTPLPERYANQFAIFSQAPEDAAQRLVPDAIDTLSFGLEHLRGYHIRMQQGILYATRHEPVSEHNVTVTVDVLVAFLDKFTGPAAAPQVFARSLAALPQREYRDPSMLAKIGDAISFITFAGFVALAVITTTG